MRDYNKEISQKTREAEKTIQELKNEIATLAEEGRTIAYWGDYGYGETYYSKGYVEDNKEDEEVSWLMDSQSYVAGSWISSSETC